MGEVLQENIRFEDFEISGNFFRKFLFDIFSHFLNARLLEEDISKLVIEDTLESEALRLHQDGLTSLFEINRLKQYF